MDLGFTTQLDHLLRCITLGKALNFSELWAFPVKMGIIDNRIPIMGLEPLVVGTVGFPLSKFVQVHFFF